MLEVWVHAPDSGERLAIIAERGDGWVFRSAVVPRALNQVTEAVLTLAYQPGLVALFPLDARLEFWDEGRLEGETQWFVRVPPKLIYDEAGALVVEVRAACALYLLAGRIVAYPAGSAQAEKTGPADDLIKQVVRENLGALAGAERDLSAHLDVAGDVGLGATVRKTMPRRNVLLVCQELARASAQAGVPLFFDVVWVAATRRLELRTYVGMRGADHRAETSAPVVLSPEFGTLREAARSFDHRNEATVVYCAGRGRGDERVIVSVADDARRLATPFNRREVFVDARYLALAESVATEADATLWRRRPVQELSGAFADTATWRYGRDWGWGDLLAAEFAGEVLTVLVHRTELRVAGGERRVVGELRADSTEADDAVRRIEGALDATAADELPVFSAEPLAGAAVLALPSGFLDDGWLSASIAWTLDLASEAAARTAGDDALAEDIAAEASLRAAGDTTLAADISAEAAARATADSTEASTRAAADGSLSAAIAAEGSARAAADSAESTARAAADTALAADISAEAAARAAADSSEASTRAAADSSEASARAAADSAHAGLTTSAHGGIVSSSDARLSDARTPTAHAASHKDGGGDEIATATPSANAIPKSGASGNLDAWISAALARIASGNNWTAAQTFVPTHSTATTPLTVMSYNVVPSGVTPAAGFGQDHVFNAQADAGTNRNMHLQRTTWVSAVDASRKARTIFYTFDTAAREAFRIEASGSAPMIGFLGAAAVVRQAVTALTVSVGTADGVVADVGSAFNQATLNNNFRDLADKINQLRTALVNLGLVG